MQTVHVDPKPRGTPANHGRKSKLRVATSILCGEGADREDVDQSQHGSVTVDCLCSSELPTGAGGNGDAGGVQPILVDLPTGDHMGSDSGKRKTPDGEQQQQQQQQQQQLPRADYGIKRPRHLARSSPKEKQTVRAPRKEGGGDSVVQGFDEEAALGQLNAMMYIEATQPNLDVAKDTIRHGVRQWETLKDDGKWLGRVIGITSAIHFIKLMLVKEGAVTDQDERNTAERIVEMGRALLKVVRHEVPYAKASAELSTWSCK